MDGHVLTAAAAATRRSETRGKNPAGFESSGFRRKKNQHDRVCFPLTRRSALVVRRVRTNNLDLIQIHSHVNFTTEDERLARKNANAEHWAARPPRRGALASRHK
jgi:hypothetical protein